MIRTFVAVNVDETLVSNLSGAMEQLRARLPSESARFVSKAGLHLTLRFLGQTHEEAVADISAALDAALENERAFEIGLSGAGAFPSTAEPQVIWLGLQQGNALDALMALQQRVAACVLQLGFAPEEHVFRPHITLARVGRAALPTLRAQVGTAVKEWNPPSTGPLKVHRVSLMESRHTSQGVQYVGLHHVPLRLA